MREEDTESPAAKRRQRSQQMQELAIQLLDLSGGLSNVQEVQHCTTRIRLRLHEPAKADMIALSNLPQVQNVRMVANQLQVIVGPEHVFKLHRQLERQLSSADMSPSVDPAKQQANAAHPPPVLHDHAGRRDRSLTGRIIHAVSFFSDIIVPMIPVFVAAGMLLGLVSLLQFLGWASVDALWFRLLQLLTGSIFQIISVMFGYYAAKRFGGTPVLGAVLGMLMSRPEIVGSDGMPPSVISSFGLVALPQFSYQGTAIPVIVASMLMAMLEIRLRRIIPSSVHVLVIPVLSLLGGSILALFVIGPLSGWLGHWCAALLEHLYAYGGTWFGLVLGGAYSSIVLTGLHQGLQAIEAGLISNPDIAVNFLLPIWSMANVAQGGAGLAVYLRTRDSVLRKAALPGALIAFLGITEPVALGVNLKLVRPFVAAAAGGAVGGAYIGWHHVVASSFGLTGIPMLAFIIPFGWSNFIHYMTGFVLATGTAFTLTLLLVRGGRSS